MAENKYMNIDQNNDHSEIIKVEEALLESLRRFRDLFEQSPIGGGILDIKGDLLVVNKSYLSIFGLDSFGKIKEKNVFKDLGLSEEEVGFIRGGKVVRKEIEYDFDDATSISSKKGKTYVFFTVAPLLSDNEVIGYMTQAQDITERKKAENSQRLAQLGHLLSNMAHEVNNPLAIISAKVKLAQMKGVKDKDMEDTLRVVSEQCEHAKDIMDRLLNYARVGKQEKVPVDAQRILELIVDILQSQFYLANISIKKEFKLTPAIVMSNEKELQQVFMNVIRNAADAMQYGGLLTIKTSLDGGFARIDIEDNGEGMSEEIRTRALEPSFSTRGDDHSGMGLTAAVSVAGRHGGTIDLNSVEGDQLIDLGQ